MSYTITTEDRGHGIIAVFVTGPANEYDAIERAGKRYAKQNLTFAPGLSGGPVSSGAEFTGKGLTVGDKIQLRCQRRDSMSDQTPLSQALASAAEHASVMAERLHKAVRLLAEQTTTVVGEQPEKFTHTDGDGGDLVVGPMMRPDRTHYVVLFAEFTGDPVVHLDQDAVNRLAQYLDQHRTDRTPCGPEDKPSPAMDDNDPVELCAGSLGPDQPANSSGCEHTRGAHGALGCRCHGCPCERYRGK